MYQEQFSRRLLRIFLHFQFYFVVSFNTLYFCLVTEVLYFTPRAQNASGFPMSLLAILFLSGIISRKAKITSKML